MTYAQRAVLVVEVMRALEQRGVERAGDEFKFQCFFPDRHEHGDLHWSASFNREKGVWCCRVCGARGGVLDLAKHLGVPWPPREEAGPPPPRLEDFARARSLTVDTLRRFDVHPVVEYGRPALRYPTSVGIDRLKFLDAQKPKYRWATTGGRAHWYGWNAALALLRAGARTLHFVNGEVSVWACAQAGIAALCPCSGEGVRPTSAMVKELATVLRALGRPIMARIVYDTDAAGRAGAHTLYLSLLMGVAKVGKLDLAAALPDVVGGDVDDLHRRVGDAGLAAALAALPMLRNDGPGDDEEGRTDAPPLEARELAPRGDDDDQETDARSIPAFPEAAWRGPFAAYRDAMAGTTEMPDAFHFASLWVMAAGTLRRRLHLYYAYPHYPNVLLVNVGASGDTKKTTGIRQGVQLVPGDAMKVLRGIGSAEALADWMTQPENAPPVAHLLVLEELATLLRRGKWEGSTVLHFLTETFDAPPVYEVPFRKNPIKVVEPTSSLLAGTTSEWFWKAMAEEDFHGGFGNRLFFLAGAPKAPIPMPPKPAARALEQVRAELAALTSGPTGEVQLAADACPVWAEFYHAFKQTKFPSLVSAATRRIPTYALKLGLVYAAFEHTVPWIMKDQLRAAVAVSGFGARCAAWLVEQRQTFRQEHRCETAVLEALERVDLPAWRIHHGIGGRFTAEELNRALRALMGTGTILEVGRTRRGEAVYGRRGRHREA